MQPASLPLLLPFLIFGSSYADFTIGLDKNTCAKTYGEFIVKADGSCC